MTTNQKEIIELIYGTLNNSCHWSDVLKCTNTELDSSHSFIASRLSTTDQPLTFYESGFDENYFLRYQEHFFTIDLWTQGLADKPLNQFHANQNVCNEKTFYNSEIYNDFAKPAGIRYGMGSLLVSPQSELITEVGIMRGPNTDSYNESSVHKANGILKHISHSLSLAYQIKKQQIELHNFEALFNQLEDPIVLIKGMSNIVFSNKAFEKLLKRTNELKQIGRHLAFKNQSLQDRFNNYSAQCLLSIDGNHNINLPFYQYLDHCMYKIEIKPWLHREVGFAGMVNQSGILLQLTPCAQSYRISETVLQQHFHFTLAEAQICSMLCQGANSTAIAQERNSSPATVRQQIKACLSKTATESQTSMICKVLKTFLRA